jgi:uncharacterized protein YbaP (TraB family)
MGFFNWTREKLKMAWALEREEKTSFLVGTAHFSPYRFERALTQLLQKVETAWFEGPLDDETLSRVAEYGRNGEGCPSVYDALNPRVLQAINRHFDDRIPHRSAESYLELFRSPCPNFLETHVRGVRPWMALFTLWSGFLGWKHSLDRDAYHLAQRLGQRICFIETIEEQIVALDGIPFERIVDYVNRFARWSSYKKQFLHNYFRGDLQALMSGTTGFPTRCESILGERDTKFFERLKPSFEEGDGVAFLGLSHILPIQKMFLDAGYRVTQITL